MFDLATLNTAAADDGGVWVPINHPVSTDPLGVEFLVRSKNSDAVRAKSKRYISRLQTDRDFREKGKVDLDLAETHRIETLVLCTMGWRFCDNVGEPRPEILLSGEWVAFSAARARALYEDHGFAWLRTQVEATAEDEANFLPKGVKPSTNTPATASPSPVQPIQTTAPAAP